MKIPIEGDRIRIRHGERVTEETCFDSLADLARVPYGRTMSVLSKIPYQLGSLCWLMGEEGQKLAVLVHRIEVSRWSPFNRVTFSMTMPATV
jgi:hypothetical protein